MKTLHCLTLFLAIQYIAAQEPPAESSEIGKSGENATGPPPPPKPPTRPYPNILKHVEGTFPLVEVNINTLLPSQVTVWQLMSQTFQVIIWPAKFCQAVYICFIQKVAYNDFNFFDVKQDMCENSYMKFYPNIGEVKYKLNGQEEKTEYYMEHIVDFKSQGNSKFQTTVSSEKHTKLNDWIDPNKKSNLIIDLSGMDLLILSSSRFCHPLVVQASREPYYFSVFDVPHIVDTTVLPQVFFDGLKMVKSTFIPAVDNEEKTVDLLENLKTATFVNSPEENKLKHFCSPYVLSDLSGSVHFSELSDSVSVNSVVVSPSTDSIGINTTTIRSFSINTNDCHWFRVWVSDAKTRMSEYNTAMNLANTLDFFFDEGFYMTPNSDVARPLPGDSSHIGLIRFKVHAKQDDTSKSLVEISMGPFGKSYTYYEHFNLNLMHQKDFAVHLIRSPKCSANLAQDNLFEYNTVDAPNQMLLFGLCEFTYFSGTTTY